MGEEVWYEFHGFAFTWNAEKAQRNFEKHGVSFEEASQAVVNDVQLTEELDEEGEQRFGIISFTLVERLSVPIFVVVADAGEAWRIISARRATPAERDRYEKEIGAY